MASAYWTAKSAEGLSFSFSLMYSILSLREALSKERSSLKIRANCPGSIFCFSLDSRGSAPTRDSVTFNHFPSPSEMMGGMGRNSVHKLAWLYRSTKNTTLANSSLPSFTTDGFWDNLAVNSRNLINSSLTARSRSGSYTNSVTPNCFNTSVRSGVVGGERECFNFL